MVYITANAVGTHDMCMHHLLVLSPASVYVLSVSILTSYVSMDDLPVYLQANSQVFSFLTLLSTI